MATNRLEYRDPRQPRAIRVYTIAQESRYLIIENIPSLGVIEDLISKCSKFGQVEEYRMLDNHDSSTEHMDVVWIQYDTITSARFAKRKMDDKPFYTSLLCVKYAPQYETFDDMRIKFADRFQAVRKKLLNCNSSSGPKDNSRRFIGSGSSTSITEEEMTTTKVAPRVYGPTIAREEDHVNKTVKPLVKKRRRI